jgi:DNA-binding MarR family transcriptional regulator
VPPRTPDAEPVAVALQRLMTAFAAHSMQTLLELDLTMAQFRALQIIWKHGSINGRDLARELGVTPAAVVLVCDQLQKRGYVERVRDDKDRRVWYFQPTPATASALEGLTRHVRSRLGPVLGKLSATDRAHLSRMLNTLADALGAPSLVDSPVARG